MEFKIGNVVRVHRNAVVPIEFTGAVCIVVSVEKATISRTAVYRIENFIGENTFVYTQEITLVDLSIFNELGT